MAEEEQRDKMDVEEEEEEGLGEKMDVENEEQVGQLIWRSPLLSDFDDLLLFVKVDFFCFKLSFFFPLLNSFFPFPKSFCLLCLLQRAEPKMVLLQFTFPSLLVCFFARKFLFFPL